MALWAFAGGTVLAIALRAPRVLAPVAAQWERVGARVSAITTPVVLTLLWSLVLTPVAVARRLFGSPIRRDSRAASLWVVRAPHDEVAARAAMEHQY